MQLQWKPLLSNTPAFLRHPLFRMSDPGRRSCALQLYLWHSSIGKDLTFRQGTTSGEVGEHWRMCNTELTDVE
jgi:hypothetical protein